MIPSSLLYKLALMPDTAFEEWAAEIGITRKPDVRPAMLPGSGWTGEEIGAFRERVIDCLDDEGVDNS